MKSFDGCHSVQIQSNVQYKVTKKQVFILHVGAVNVFLFPKILEWLLFYILNSVVLIQCTSTVHVSPLLNI